ncbi:MAG: phosphoglycerate kinase [Candidatus Bathyarchaeota archaeon]|nr:MAG: phosphoglycerate kinase [Candidatus Bathyarchaeota archaeon]
MLADFQTIEDYNFDNKTAIIRVDFNSPIDKETKEITDDTRIKAHAPTIQELLEKNAKVVILAHQGRPGSADYSTTEKHAQILSAVIHQTVAYINDIFGEKAQQAIKQLKPGEALLLENVRSWPGERAKMSAEEFAQSDLVKNLAPLVDVYVGDGFAVAHRANASIVGFPEVVPSVAGRVMERELNALIRAKNAEEKPCIYVMGGAKADDAAAISEYVLSNDKADYVLTSGVIGHLFLHAKGVDLGKPNVEFLTKKQFLQYVPKIQELYGKYNGKIVNPQDFATDVNGKRQEITLDDLPTNYPIFDIGQETVKIFAELLRNAKIVVISGPMGVYEREEFIMGTRGVFETIANSQAFSVAGGGNTIEAIEKLGLREKISYISTGGGALMEFLTGKTLPGVEALIKAAKRG